MGFRVRVHRSLGNLMDSAKFNCLVTLRHRILLSPLEKSCMTMLVDRGRLETVSSQYPPNATFNPIFPINLVHPINPITL